MVNWSDIGHPFGLGRKKTFVDRVQDVAEDVYDRFQDVAEDVVERIEPVVRGPAKESRKRASLVWDRAEGGASRAQKSAAQLAERARQRGEHSADEATERVLEVIEATRERLTPVIKQSRRSANMALARTSDQVASSVQAAERASRDAARMAAARSAAAADAAGGLVSNTGSALGTFARAIWGLTLFLVKAAILLGVAYAGWEWLQSRRQDNIWSTPTYTPPAGGTGNGGTGTSYTSGSSYPSPAGAVG